MSDKRRDKRRLERFMQAADRLDDVQWVKLKQQLRERLRGPQLTVLAAGEYRAEAAIAFYKAKNKNEHARGLGALLENNFTFVDIDYSFLFRRGFSSEFVSENDFSAWVVAFTTTRLERDAFIAWVSSIVGPFGGEVKDGGKIPCDLLNTPESQYWKGLH
jgi:hypothetical protein